MVLLLGRGTAKSCPICGAENMACQAGDAPKVGVVRDTDWEVRSDGTIIVDARYKFRVSDTPWVSDRDELVQVGEKKFERRYARGDAIPFIVALRQGQVHPAQVGEAEKQIIRQHVEAGTIDLAEVKETLLMAKKKKPLDRAIHEGQVVQKAVDDDASDLLARVS